MFKKYHRLLIVTFTVLLTCVSTLNVYAANNPVRSSAAGTFYVSSLNGSDGNDGKQTKPWRTIQKAANAMPPGSTVIVLEGNYPERVTVSRSNLSFRAQGNVTMQGFKIVADNISVSGFTITSLVDNFSKGVGILVAEGGNCLIEDNSFLYNTWGGVRLLGDTDDPDATHDCTIRDNVFVRNGLYAVEIKGINHLIETNEVSHSIQHHPCTSSTASWLDADAFRFHGSGHIFRDNYIHDIPFGDSGYDQTGCSVAALSNLNNDYVSDSHTDCFQTYGGDEDIAGHDILFENNRCELPLANEWIDGAGAKAFQGSGNTYNLTFRNNLVVADLISLFSDGCHDLTFVQNTFIGSGHKYSQGLQFEGCSGVNTIKNNVFYRQENGIGHIWPVNTQVNAGYNCIYNASGTPSRPADPGDVWDVDPLLESDHSLSANSPCIDAGTNLGVSTDIEGNSRPQGNGPDMGAFEFGGGGDGDDSGDGGDGEDDSSNISRWTPAFDYNHGWRVSNHPRMFADVDGDGDDDAVGFGLDGIYVALSNGDRFSESATRWTTAFDYLHGWRVSKHPRMFADVNGDGKDDAVGFGLDGVYVALSNGNGFAPNATRWTTAFDYLHGWRVSKHARMFADVNGDGKADAVGFGVDGVYVALSNGSGFESEPNRWTTAFSEDSGWPALEYPRMLADVDGDGDADAVGFGSDGVYVALSNGKRFSTHITRWSTAFSYSDGWRVSDHPRMFADMDGDGMDDAIGFGFDGVYVARSTGNGFESDPIRWTTSFDYNHGWRVSAHPRMVADVNGDNNADSAGFGLDGVYITLSE